MAEVNAKDSYGRVGAPSIADGIVSRQHHKPQESRDRLGLSQLARFHCTMLLKRAGADPEKWEREVLLLGV